MASFDRGVMGALVRYHESAGRLVEAESVLRRVRRSRPRSVVAITALASYLRRQSRPDEAESLLRDGLAIEPRAYSLLNELAYLYAESGMRLAEALSLADAALALAPDEPALQDTKAWALFRLRRFGEAEPWARRSLEAREDPDVREHLGDILESQGRSEEALTAWRQALAELPEASSRRAQLADKVAHAEQRQRPH